MDDHAGGKIVPVTPWSGISKRVQRLGNLNLARNLAIGEGVNKVRHTQKLQFYIAYYAMLNL